MQLPIQGCKPSAGQYDVSAEILQVFDEQHVTETARRNVADVAAYAEVLCRVDGGHLQRRHWRQSLGNCMPDHSVHVTLPDKGFRMRIIRAEDEVPRIEPETKDGRAAVPQHRAMPSRIAS